MIWSSLSQMMTMTICCHTKMTPWWFWWWPWSINYKGSTNVLYWDTFQKLGLPESSLEECSSTLIDFLEEQVEIQGVVDFRTFNAGSNAKAMIVKFMVINAWASYNMILSWSTLNRLQAIMSTSHHCMKFLVACWVGIVRADQCVACWSGIGGRTDKREDKWPNPHPRQNLKDLRP
ncbi:hypothetical protein CR513_44893, partial [Mucuna pruriens]